MAPGLLDCIPHILLPVNACDILFDAGEDMGTALRVTALDDDVLLLQLVQVLRCLEREGERIREAHVVADLGKVSRLQYLLPRPQKIERVWPDHRMGCEVANIGKIFLQCFPCEAITRSGVPMQRGENMTPGEGFPLTCSRHPNQRHLSRCQPHKAYSNQHHSSWRVRCETRPMT